METPEGSTLTLHTRMKDNAVYTVVDERDVPVHRNLRSDNIILLTGAPHADWPSPSAPHARTSNSDRAIRVENARTEG